MYDTFVYRHPKTGKGKSLLAVNYQAVSDYEKGRRSRLFMTYKAIIIFCFVLCMVMELREIIVVTTWLLTFPSEAEVDEGVKEEHDEEGNVTKYTVQGITHRHRLTCACLTLARFVLAVFLTWTGVVFLLQDTDYVNLLLNSVGLVFVIEIACHLYGQLLDPTLREQCENSDPFLVPMDKVWKKLWVHNPAVRDLITLTCIVAVLAGGMYLHYIHIARPLSTALECTCLSQGEHCFEANKFNKDFWETYWDHDVPEIFASVKKMKKEHANDDSKSGASDVVDSPAPAIFVHGGLQESQQHFTTLKVHPTEVDVVKANHASRERHHSVTRLLNGHGRRRSVFF